MEKQYDMEEKARALIIQKEGQIKELEKEIKELNKVLEK